MRRRPVFMVATATAILALFASALVVAAAPPLVQTSNVYYFTGGQVIGAESTLARKSESVHMQIRTKDLDPGATYTVWWVIFNNPDACEHPMPELGLACGEGDLLDDAGMPIVDSEAQTSVLHATGHVVGNNGMGNFNAKLKVGQLTGDVLWGPGLLDSMEAEIHLVVRTHGEPKAGMVSDQIHTFAGGCGPDLSLCEDQQFAAYPAP